MLATSKRNHKEEPSAERDTERQTERNMLCWGELGSGIQHKPGSQTGDGLTGQRIQHVCSRDGVTVFVLANGKVYIRVRRRKRKTEPGQFIEFNGQKIHFADSGTSHILFLSGAGSLYCSKIKSKETAAKLKEFPIMKPQLLKCLRTRKIIQVACGNNHSLALSKDGELFAWGQNTYGQLGIDTKGASQPVPQCVTSLTGMPVAQITAGGEHSFALSLSGAVFGWGRNNRGQLGLKDTEDRYEPNHVKLLERKKTIHISCGEEHTVVLTKIDIQCYWLALSLQDLASTIDQSSSIILNRIMMLDNFLEKQLCKERRMAIMQAFSSSQTLCGSFLDASKDSHFNTNREVSGLNLSAACRGFEDLAKNSSMLRQVKNAVEDKLIPSLPRSPACVETMRVYIILPELIAVLEDSRDSAMLTDSFNKAILSLEESYFKILECWWSTMPDDSFARLVGVYQKISKQLLQLTMEGTLKDNSKLHDSLTILQTLYKVNSSRCMKILERTFCIPVMTIFTQCIMVCVAKWFPANPAVAMLQLMSGNLREHELEFQQDCLAFYNVRFTGEACYGPGVSLEFFTLFGRELHSNGQIFQRSEDSELLWFPSWEPERDEVFHLVGIICGLAASNRFICNFHFPLALYKKLLQVQPTLEDLKELSPVEGKSLQDILDYEYDDTEEEFCLDFTIPKQTADGDTIYQELIPNGSKIPLQKHNRKQYVDAYVNYKLNTSVKKQFEAFARGFRNSALPVVNLFRPEELRDLIHGNADYEWDLLEKNAGYDGYTQTDKTVRNFWEVFGNLEEEKKKRFLAFLSGSDRLPVGGIQSFQIAIINTRSSEPDSSYPRAYTCSRSLDLPNYSSIEILREKLLHAIESGEEFNAQPP
ncbi:hypothetical protein scyTo_0006394 [Scyliorhinus torazame]|uniref:HECT domain-containing protein n=1 Tax=Scyliorhinus torazame TaxID=75743 RepID=A0A401PHR1_SCYTO|nr:hypothetical protein [Scyliorhinus torazame]